MSRLRKVAIVVGVLLLLAAGAAAYFVLTFDANRYRGVILAQLSRAVNRPVEAADLNLQLFPLRLRLNQVRIPEAPGFAGEDFLRADAVQFDFSLWSLLSGSPRVTALELERPTIYLRPDNAGRWNISTLAGGEGGAAAAEPTVQNWEINDGTLVIERAAQAPLRLTGVHLAISDLSTTQPFPFELTVGFSPESRLDAHGQVGPLNLETLTRTPLDAEIRLEKFRPAALNTLVSVPPLLARLREVDGTLSLKATVTETTASGDLKLRSASEGSDVKTLFTLMTPPAFDGLDIREAAVESGHARLSGSGKIDFKDDPTRFDLVLSTSDAAVADLKSIAGALGVPVPASAASLSGLLTAALKLGGTSDDWQLTGTAMGRDITYSLAGLAQPLRAPSLQLTFEPARIAAAPFQVSPQAGVTLTVSGAVENYRQQPRLAARVTGDEMPVEPLLALLAGLGKSPLGEKQKLTGRVKPDIQLNGPLAEPSRLTYEGRLLLRDLSLTTPELPEPLRSPAVDLSFDAARLSAPAFTAQVGSRLQAQASFRLDDYQTSPRLSARLTTEGASLEALLGLARALGSDPLPGGRATGQASATLELTGTLGEKAPPLALQGQAQLTDASLQPATIREPIKVERARFDFSRDRLAVSNLRMVAAGTVTEGSLRVDNFAAPRVQFDLKGGTLDLERLQNLFAAEAPARAAAFAPAVVHAAEKESDWFARLTGRGRLDFDQLRHGTLTLAPFGAPVSIENQTVTCDPIEFGLYDGGGRGRLVLDLRGREPVTSFDGLLRGVDANKLLSANSSQRDRLYGRLGGTLSVQFSGDEKARMTQSATGKGNLSLVNGRLAQVNLSRELVLLGQLAGLQTQGRDTPIEDMLTDFNVAGGWVRTANLTLNTPDLTMTAAGGFSLEDELAFEATATFTPEASRTLTSRMPFGQLTGQVLSDDQGRLVIPFLIRGTMAQPKFTLDAKRLLEMRLRRGRTGTSSPLQDILDRLRKKTNE